MVQVAFRNDHEGFSFREGLSSNERKILRDQGRRHGTGRIEHDVRFQRLDTGSLDHAGIDAAYHAKYDSYGPRIVGGVVGPTAAKVTLHLLPR
jgi:hypothetical protein